MSHGELALNRYTVHALIATSTVYSLLCLQYPIHSLCSHPLLLSSSYFFLPFSV